MKKRKKISILNILFALLILTLISSLVFKNREKLQNIFIKKNKIKVPQETNFDKLEIGDIVYYNHKDVIKVKSEDPAMQEKYNKMQKDHEANQTVTIPLGDSANPGFGYHFFGTRNQTFNAKKYNTTWRVWDKLSDGRVMLVSNRAVGKSELYGAVSYMWWEHNAHKVSSIFGYGEGADTSATQGTEYKVGSGIDDAPDMMKSEDKGTWTIGGEFPKDEREKINISGARSLTLPEVEKKLGITYEGIKNKTTSSGSNAGSPGYGNQTTTSIRYVVQRDINSSNQIWKNKEDREEGIAKNKSYKMTDRHYYWNKDSIPETKYKDMLFNGIDGVIALATNVLNVSNGGSYVNFSMAYVYPSELRSARDGLSMMYSNDRNWGGNGYYPSLRIAVYLKSKIKYIPAGDNAWDIYESSSEDKDLKLKVLNLSSEPASKIGLEVGKASTGGVAPEDTVGRLVARQEADGKIEYIVKVKKFYGQKRDKDTKGDNATFSKIDNKYNVEITGIPSGYDFKIIGKEGKQIDLDTDTNLEYELVIYPKAGKQVVQVEYDGGKYDKTFKVTGNVVIKSGDEELGRINGVTLNNDVSFVEVDNVDLFDQTNKSIRKYTVEFEKTDTSLHTVAFDPKNKKLVVTYVSPNREITVSVAEDSKKYLTNISEIKLKLVGGEEKNIILKPNDYTFKLTVPETDKDGNPINYSIQKVENIPGYYWSIDGFNVKLKPILKLPYTGTELSSKNIAILGFSILGFALVFRFRKKLVLIFKEYTMMK